MESTCETPRSLWLSSSSRPHIVRSEMEEGLMAASMEKRWQRPLAVTRRGAMRDGSDALRSGLRQTPMSWAGERRLDAPAARDSFRCRDMGTLEVLEDALHPFLPRRAISSACFGFPGVL